MISNTQKLLTALFFGATALLFSSCDDILGIKGKGDLVTEVRSAKDFHAVDIATPGALELRVDSVFHVEVTCEESIIAYLQTIEDNGVLKILFDHDVYDVDHLKIMVSAPSWDGIEIRGSANVDAPDAIAGDVFNLDVSGSGNMKIFKADFNKIKARITGSGDIAIDGSADDLNCTITGSGNFDALNCPVLTATVSISGSGNARLDVAETLDVTITGSGNVEYRGNAAVDAKVTGSGRVRKI